MSGTMHAWAALLERSTLQATTRLVAILCVLPLCALRTNMSGTMHVSIALLERSTLPAMTRLVTILCVLLLCALSNNMCRVMHVWSALLGPPALPAAMRRAVTRPAPRLRVLLIQLAQTLRLAVHASLAFMEQSLPRPLLRTTVEHARQAIALLMCPLVSLMVPHVTT